MAFDLNRFRAEFAAKMAKIIAYIDELDVAGDDLHRRVSGFSSRAI
jgi:hypothetical protein